MEMENHVFQKAKSKEEYLAFVARLILHIREMSKGNKYSIIFNNSFFLQYAKYYRKISTLAFQTFKVI